MTSENSLAIRVRLDFGDALRASRLYLISTVPSWPFSQVILGVIPLSLGVWYWRYLLTASFDPHDNVIVSFAIAASLCLWGVAILLMDSIATAFLWLSFRKNSKLYSESYQAIFDETGMAVQRKSSNAKYEWGFFKEILEGRSDFLLLYGKGLYYSIPKKSFESESDLTRFRNMLKGNVAKFKQIRIKVAA